MQTRSHQHSCLYLSRMNGAYNIYCHLLLLHCSNIGLIQCFNINFNKTVKKYLASYIDETTLNWDEFLPALMLAYNTSYHSTIATTPFELLFGIRPRLPSLPAPEIQQHHYGESFPAERLQLLQHARQVARKNAEQQGLKYKLSFDQSAAPHKFKIEQKVWLSDTTALGKNPVSVKKNSSIFMRI